MSRRDGRPHSGPTANFGTGVEGNSTRPTPCRTCPTSGGRFFGSWKWHTTRFGVSTLSQLPRELWRAGTTGDCSDRRERQPEVTGPPVARRRPCLTRPEVEGHLGVGRPPTYGPPLITPGSGPRRVGSWGQGWLRHGGPVGSGRPGRPCDEPRRPRPARLLPCPRDSRVGEVASGRRRLLNP